MSRRPVLVLVALAAFALLPSAQGQTAHTLTVEIEDLPESIESNGTQVAIPFQVRATVGGAAPCVTTTAGSEYTITLSAEVVDSTGNHTTANVNPRQVTIAGPVLLSAAGQAERTEEAVLVVSSGPYSGDALNATVLVTATFEGGNSGCAGTGATAASSDEAQVAANFEPVPTGFGGNAPGQELPAPGAALLLVALGMVALALRTRGGR